MKNLFRKYWWAVLIGAIILCFAILVQVFRKASPLPETDLQGVAEEIFTFLQDWAIALSASVALLLVIVTFMALRENRRIGALNRIRSWAAGSNRVLTATRFKGQGLTVEQKLKRIRADIQAVMVDSLGALADAEALGGDLKERVGDAVISVANLKDIVEQHPDRPTLEAVLKKAVENLTDVINSTSGL